MLDNTPNQQSKFRTKNWIEIIDDLHGMYHTNNQIKLNTSMLKSSLYNYSDTYILVKGTISITPLPPTAVTPNKNDKEVVFKNCVPFIDCISKNRENSLVG